MFKQLEQYLTTKYMRFDEGQVWFGKERIGFYFMPHLATEFLTCKKAFGLKYCAAMFLAGRERGKLFVKKHGVPLKKILTPVVQISCDVLNTFGFGSFRTLKVDDKDGFMVLLGKSTLANEVKKNFETSPEPVDFMLGGLFAGAAEYFMKDKRYAVETRCAAQKDVQECVWVIGREDQIRRYVTKFSPESKEWTDAILKEIKTLEEKLG